MEYTSTYIRYMSPAQIIEALLAKGWKQSELAAKLNTDQPNVSRWRKGQEPRGPSRDLIRDLAATEGVIQPPKDAPRPLATVVMVPLISWVGAGRLVDSATQTPASEARAIPFGDLGPGDFFALAVKGDSMDRISPEGSIIVVNRRDKQLLPGKAYVFAIRGETTFKLWQPKPPRLEPFSTNPAHEAKFLDTRRGIFVVGRVRRTLLDL